jgi:hypothetical protein
MTAAIGTSKKASTQAQNPQYTQVHADRARGLAPALLAFDASEAGEAIEVGEVEDVAMLREFIQSAHGQRFAA